MNSESAYARFAELLSKLLDDQLSDSELIELQSLLKAEPTLRAAYIDHQLLDSLLAENLGQEPLTALIDLIGNNAEQDVSREFCQPKIGQLKIGQLGTVAEPGKPVPTSSRRMAWLSGWLVVVASLLLILSLLSWQGERQAFASATQVVQAAMHTHSAPIERIYVVDVKRSAGSHFRFELPRDVRVATQGDRFWVQVRGIREWAWGRDEQGAIWLTLGANQAVVVSSDEMGTPLQHIGDLYTLQLETLLENLLKHCSLEKSDGPAGSTLIVATPRRQWSHRALKRATFEVDRETKAIRKLVVEREFAGQTLCTIEFTLVDSRLAEESDYVVEGHLQEPHQIYSNETSLDKRREMVMHWFGPIAARWIATKMPIDESQN